jgi:hypothetical protein
LAYWIATTRLQLSGLDWTVPASCGNMHDFP